MGIFGGNKSEKFEAERLSALEDDAWTHVEELKGEIANLRHTVIERDRAIESAERARAIDVQVMDSNRDTIDTWFKRIGELEAAAGPLGKYVANLVRRAAASDEVELSAEDRAYRLAEQWVRQDIEALLVRQKRAEIDQETQEWLADGGREELGAEISSILEADGTYDSIREEVRQKARDERQQELLDQVKAEAQADAESPSTIKAEKKAYEQQLEDEGVIDQIYQYAQAERAQEIVADIMTETLEKAARYYRSRKASGELRAQLESDPEMVARREEATVDEVRRLTNLSAEEFMAASTKDDPELAAYVEEQARKLQHTKMLTGRLHELRRSWGADKCLDLAQIPDGMNITIQGYIVGAPAQTSAAIALESRDGEFVINRTRVDTSRDNSELAKKVIGLNDRMALVGRVIAKRNGETEWSSEIQPGTTMTLRTDEKGDNDVQIEVRMVKFPSSASGTV